MLSFSVSFKGVQTIPWRHAQIFQSRWEIDVFQFACSAFCNLWWEAPGFAVDIEFVGSFIAE